MISPVLLSCDHLLYGFAACRMLRAIIHLRTKNNLRLPSRLTSLLKGLTKQEDGKCVTGVQRLYALEYIPYFVLSKHITVLCCACGCEIFFHNKTVGICCVHYLL